MPYMASLSVISAYIENVESQQVLRKHLEVHIFRVFHKTFRKLKRR